MSSDSQKLGANNVDTVCMITALLAAVKERNVVTISIIGTKGASTVS